MSQGSSAGPGRFVESRVRQCLEESPAWPANIFKLECEAYGIYQSATGNVLKALLDDEVIGKVSIEIETGNDDSDDSEYPFFTRLDDPSPEPTEEVVDATRLYYEFVHKESYFGELAAYVALCKVFDEIGGGLSDAEILPKGHRTHQLNGHSNELDGFARLPGEYVPVEVYNGGNYLGFLSDKYDWISDVSIEENPRSNPFLINRLSDDGVRSEGRTENGMVVDTGIIIGCTSVVDEMPGIVDALEFLNVDDLVQLVPPLEFENGTELTGDDYHSLATNNEQGDLLRPISNVADAASELPEQYLNRIRGGMQLQYVNTFYRRADEPIDECASLVLQEAYNLLLRNGGHNQDDVLEMAWENASDKYAQRTVLKDEKDDVVALADGLLDDLRHQRIVVSRNSQIHARRSEHPQPSLSFL